MGRLSSPIADIEGHYDVVIVGSGYGGAIAALRLARARREDGHPLKVCIFERGRELQPGDYPDTPAQVFAETQVDTPTGHVRSPTGLYDFRVNDDVNVLVGCGLGGTSLINANVALRPLRRVFQEPAWPAELRSNPAALDKWFDLAADMLQLETYPRPPAYPPLRKTETLERSARHLRRRYGYGNFRLPCITVGFSDRVRRFPGPAGEVEVEQHACQLCGDCVSGCNYGAKNTLLTSYLPDARANGAEIYTEVSVRRIQALKNERADGSRWLVHFELPDTGRERFQPLEMTVGARVVVLAAGTLGSTEILLRSRESRPPEVQLTLSDQLGKGFTANGDVLALAYSTDEPVNGVGSGRRRPNPGEPVGPCITGMIDMRGRPNLERDMIIQEGSIPGALASLMPGVLGGAMVMFGGDTRARVRESLREEVRRLLKYLRNPYHGAVRNTQVFLVMGHDDAGGRMELQRDRLRISWPGLERQWIFVEAERRLREATRELGGTYLQNPVNPITVHPLGGCRMAEAAEDGVVDHKGRVFSGRRGDAVHKGLYVCDGSIIPRSLGVNPLLTISALAERMCALMAPYNW